MVTCKSQYSQVNEAWVGNSLRELLAMLGKRWGVWRVEKVGGSSQVFPSGNAWRFCSRIGPVAESILCTSLHIELYLSEESECMAYLLVFRHGDLPIIKWLFKQGFMSSRNRNGFVEYLAIYTWLQLPPLSLFFYHIRLLSFVEICSNSLEAREKNIYRRSQETELSCIDDQLLGQ